MIDTGRLLISQGSLYLKFIPKDGLFHKILLLCLWDFKLVDVTLYHKQVHILLALPACPTPLLIGM